MNERGSLAILVAGYLALILTLFIGGFSVAMALIAQNRIQGVVDSAILYAHDRAAVRGVPDSDKLQQAAASFLANAPSAKQLELISVETSVTDVKSTLVLCASHIDPMGKYLAGKICKVANAESFLVD
jgi:hypothetical protein